MSMIEEARKYTDVGALAADASFADIAVELRLIEKDVIFREAAYVTKLEYLVASHTRSELLLLAARVGLSPDVTRNMLDNWEVRARLCAAASEFFRALIPHEQAIKKLIAASSPGQTK